MKHYRELLLLGIICLFVNSSCQKNSTDPALELYRKYADSTNVTVAYLNDFEVHGNNVNTVMLEAHDDDAWEWLLDEFAVSQQVIREVVSDTLTDPSYAVEVGMKWDTPMVVDDNIFEKEHLSDEEIDVFAQAIVNQFSSAISSLLESDSQVHNASIIISDDIDLMSDMNFGMEFRDTTAVKRILQTVSDRLNADGLAFNETILPTESSFATIEQPADIMPEAQKHGDDGYIVAVDYPNQTLWVFFYDKAKESASIMQHIRKDIMVVAPR